MADAKSNAESRITEEEASANANDGEEYLIELANQMASSQVAAEFVAPVTDAAAAAAQQAKKLPLIGDIAERADDAYNALKRVTMRKADEVIASNATSMINSIGVTMLNSIHDHAMPQGIHRFVDSAYGHIWPQMKKTLMDSVMLGAGFEFREHQRKHQSVDDAEPPRGVLRYFAARLIYAMEPYDLTIWGIIRSPLSLVIQIAFLFPFYGVSDMLVLTLAASKYFTNYNEFGLIQFIISSKRLQFITTGLFSGSYAFSKLFICATLRENRNTPGWTASGFECETFAPGTHYTFPFEFCLFTIRSMLNWVVFAMLWNFDKLVSKNRVKDQMLLAQQRLMAGAERRGLFGPFLTGILVLLSWQLSIAAVASIFVAVYYAKSFDFGLGDLMPYFDLFVLAVVMQLVLHRLLTRPCIDATPAQLAMVLSLAAIPYVWVRMDLPAFAQPLQWDTVSTAIAAGAWANLSTSVRSGLELDVTSLTRGFTSIARLPMTLELLIASMGLVIFIGLLVLQRRAKRKDEAAVERLQNLMSALDTDRDGSVGKLELRKTYEHFFTRQPALEAAATEEGSRADVEGAGGDGGGRSKLLAEADKREVQSFEEFWAQLDTNQDGRVTLHELAAHYGVAHLVPDHASGKAQIKDEDDPQYLERRLEELHAREFGQTEHRPGGALLYFVMWDVTAFSLAFVFIFLFMYSEVIEGDIHTVSEALADWRIRCGLYFLKVVIALLSFPFLIFALPFTQNWLTHVKPTGYDRAGNCIPSLSSSQIKAKFRAQYIAKQQSGEAGQPTPWYEDCWDKVLGVDPEAELAIEDGDLKVKAKKGAKGSVVELARQRRMQQARRERLPEATLIFAEHATSGPHEGKLQIRGDPGSLMML